MIEVVFLSIFMVVCVFGALVYTMMLCHCLTSFNGTFQIKENILESICMVAGWVAYIAFTIMCYQGLTRALHVG